MTQANVPLLPDKIIEGDYFDRKGRLITVKSHEFMDDLLVGSNGYLYGPRGDANQYNKLIETDTDDDLVAVRLQSQLGAT